MHQLILSKIDEGDIYHWCDVGCHFNTKGISRLKEYIDIVSKDTNGFLGFSYKNPNFEGKYKNYKYLENFEYEYTKSDLIKYFNLSYDDPIIQSSQVWGGSFFIKTSFENCSYPETSFATFWSFKRSKVFPTRVSCPGVHNDPVS